MRWTKEMDARLRSLKGQHYTCAQIAKVLSAELREPLSRCAVIGRCSRLGIPTEPKKVTRERQRQANHVRAKAVHAIKVSSRPRCTPAPFRARAPADSPTRVRFILRTKSQCPMFLRDESGPDGFVCGAPVPEGASWCASCARVVYQPVRVNLEEAA